ncbi:MAG: sigma 54-interacting transcriptional regulator [Myxococcales bacterium]|nr:sigma 54-interacting transcriptional regulator [Myxococcales bacterium]MCB9642010.1 sigma 54-interacting transcriptional regulator [Myxococcales bacterium]
MSAKVETLIASGGLLSSSLATDDVSLEVVEGPHKGAILRLEQEVSRIGRAEWCDLVLTEDPWVSSEHCECSLEARGVRVRDMGSRNGLLLNDCPVLDAYMVAGSRLKIGNSVMQLVSHHRKREIVIKYQDDSGLLVGRSPQMRKIFSMLDRLRSRNIAIFLGGETGTGKSTIARAIHTLAGDTKAPFVMVNCGALPSGLIESELFGYEKGAFTGADSSHEGFFQQANGGTLFLDEIAELPLELQPKLLDVLDRKKVRRIGGKKEVDVDFRLITATHRHLPTEVEARRFREDLYFRIAVVELLVPPLRERSEDIPLLIERILRELFPDTKIRLTEDATAILKTYLWPGNVRQLRNVLERSVTFLEGDVLRGEDLLLPSDAKVQSKKEEFVHPMLESSSLAGLVPSEALKQGETIALKDVMDSIEKAILIQALEIADRNVQEAAAMLSISPAWLYNRIKKYNITNKRD